MGNFWAEALDAVSATSVATAAKETDFNGNFDGM